MDSSNTHVVFFLVGGGLRGCNLDLSQLGQISKTRQKLDFKKNPEIVGSGLCLQKFDTFVIVSSCNDRKRNLYEFAGTCTEKLVKSHHYFWWVLAIWNHCARGRQFQNYD